MSGFKKAERRAAKLKIAMTGPSGSGKTFSALRLAKGLGGKIALVDTENKSASLYSDRFDFDVMEIEPPYTTDKYLAALDAAEKAGYDILVIDSLSHQWAGDGGLLNKKEQMDARGGNSFANWAKMTPEHEKFKSAILHSNLHVIGTMRSKTEYSLGQREGGKGTSVTKMGMAPIQRDGFEYEFTVVFDVAMKHEAQTSKDRTGLFGDKIFKITEETGKELVSWITSGKAPLPATPATPPPQDRTKELQAAVNPVNWPPGSVAEYMELVYKTKKLTELTDAQFADLISRVKGMTASQAKVQAKASIASRPPASSPPSSGLMPHENENMTFDDEPGASG